MLTLKPEVLAEGITFGEGPRWHQGKLWFSDIPVGKVMTVDESGHLDVVTEIARPSGLGFLPDGDLLVVGGDPRRLYKVDARGNQSLYSDLSALGDMHPNDLVIDPDGLAYLSLSFAGKIALVRPSGETSIVAEGLNFPNGMAITADRKTLVVSESGMEVPQNPHDGGVRAFDIESDGTLKNARVFGHFEKEGPDGLCLDAEGGVWFGSFCGEKFMRVEDGSVVTHVVPTPGKWGVAPMLGGADRRTLFLLTAVVPPVAQTREAVGTVEVVRVDVPGAGWP